MLGWVVLDFVGGWVGFRPRIGEGVLCWVVLDLE